MFTSPYPTIVDDAVSDAHYAHFSPCSEKSILTDYTSSLSHNLDSSMSCSSFVTKPLETGILLGSHPIPLHFHLISPHLSIRPYPYRASRPTRTHRSSRCSIGRLGYLGHLHTTIPTKSTFTSRDGTRDARSRHRIVIAHDTVQACHLTRA